MADLSTSMLLYCFAVGLIAGGIKGMLGFAMPLMLITGLSLVVDAHTTLAALIVPTMLTNIWQAMRQGRKAAWASIVQFRWFLGVAGIMLLLSAQLVNVISQRQFFLIIGVFVTVFTTLMLSGWRPKNLKQTPATDALLGSIAGASGGISGVWGPPTVLYLTALDAPKAESVRVQGVAYGLGGLMLFIAHLGSGVLNASTLPFSAFMLIPSLLGMAIGIRIQDRIDQALFRRLTLLLLLIAGLNLIRRGLF